MKPTSPYKAYISIEGESGPEYQEIIPKIVKCVNGRFTKLTEEKQKLIKTIFEKVGINEE